MPDTQHSNQTYLCYEISYDETSLTWPRNNVRNYPYASKVLRITFYIMCNNKDSSWCIDSETGVARHDLLASLIQDEFNAINIGGGKMYLMADTPSATDNFYSTRTMIFEQITDNNLVKTNNLREGRIVAPTLNREVTSY